MNRLLSKKEAAARLGICTRTLDRYRQMYQMGDILLRGVVRFDPEAIEKIVKSGGLTLRKARDSARTLPNKQRRQKL